MALASSIASQAAAAARAAATTAEEAAREAAVSAANVRRTLQPAPLAASQSRLLEKRRAEFATVRASSVSQPQLDHDGGDEDGFYSRVTNFTPPHDAESPTNDIPPELELSAKVILVERLANLYISAAETEPKDLRNEDERSLSSTTQPAARSSSSTSLAESILLSEPRRLQFARWLRAQSVQTLLSASDEVDGNAAIKAVAPPLPGASLEGLPTQYKYDKKLDQEKKEYEKTEQAMLSEWAPIERSERKRLRWLLGETTVINKATPANSVAGSEVSDGDGPTREPLQPQQQLGRPIDECLLLLEFAAKQSRSWRTTAAPLPPADPSRLQLEYVRQRLWAAEEGAWRRGEEVMPQRQVKLFTEMLVRCGDRLLARYVGDR